MKRTSSLPLHDRLEPRHALREPLRHDCHYLDLEAVVAAYDGADFEHFREDESRGSLEPAW